MRSACPCLRAYFGYPADIRPDCGPIAACQAPRTGRAATAHLLVAMGDCGRFWTGPLAQPPR